MDILGVRIDNLSKQEILDKIGSFLDEQSPSTISGEKVLGKFHQIATINPEFVLEAQKNSDFRNVLNMCDLNVADGIGIRFASWRYGKKLKCRFAGVDLVDEILKMAENRGVGVFLAINRDGLSNFSEIKKSLLEAYPGLDVGGEDLDPHIADYRLPVAGCSIVFSNFGAPDQEIFLSSQKNDRIRLAMGVGGTFDFVTGKAKRAPVWMRKIGLEWLWRLIQQPKRLRRIFNATMVFPIKIIFARRNDE